MDKADFYIGNGLSSKWIGSVRRNGDVWNVPPELLLQINETMFEELAAEFIKANDGIEAMHVCQWPWDWADSRMTDYVYIFNPDHGKVYMFMSGSDCLFDSVKVIQGLSLDEADTYIGAPTFPIMIEALILEEMEWDGSEFTETL